MKLALFPGCKALDVLPYSLTATRGVLEALAIPFVEPEFTCCGYPVRSLNFDAFILSAAGNLALAEKLGAAVLTPCKCCYGTLRQAAHILNQNHGLREQVNTLLRPDHLQYEGQVRILHLLSFLDHNREALRSCIKRPFEGLAAAAHYGCHALRPANITRFDNPTNPSIFENLLRLTGIRPLAWPQRLSCCGNPLKDKNDRLSRRLRLTKLQDAARCGAGILCTACNYCQLQFQGLAPGDEPESSLPKALLFQQLLGCAMGLDPEQTGLHEDVIGKFPDSLPA